MSLRNRPILIGNEEDESSLYTEDNSVVVGHHPKHLKDIRRSKSVLGSYFKSTVDILTGNGSKVSYLLIPVFIALFWVLLCIITTNRSNMSLEQRLSQSYLKEYYDNHVYQEGIMEAFVENQLIDVPEGEYINIALAMPFIDVNPIVGSGYLKTVENLLTYSTAPLNFQIITNEPSRSYINVIMDKAKENTKFENFKYSVMTLDFIMDKCITEICPKIVKTTAEEYCDVVMGTMTPLLFPYLMPDLEHIIYIEKTVIFQDNIGLLYKVIQQLKRESKAGLAMVLEQSNRYMRSFGTWQRIHPSTKLGRPASEGGKPGYNEDLIIMDLEKLRSSHVYKTLLNERKMNGLMNTYKYHINGPQPDLGDFVNIMAADAEHLFHSLGCEWNRRSEYSTDILDRKYNDCVPKFNGITRAWNGSPNFSKIEKDKQNGSRTSHSFVEKKK